MSKNAKLWLDDAIMEKQEKNINFFKQNKLMQF